MTTETELTAEIQHATTVVRSLHRMLGTVNTSPRPSERVRTLIGDIIDVALSPEDQATRVRLLDAAMARSERAS